MKNSLNLQLELELISEILTGTTLVEMSSLANIYQTLDQDTATQTSYILQFLWRDLTSDFDIIGPYFY